MEHLDSRKIALTSVFAALYYLMSFLPGVPAIGVSGVKIQIEACMASVYGLILGPYLGALATFVGVFIAWALPPGKMGPLGLVLLPSPVINAFTVGLICEGKWMEAFLLLGLLNIAFWLLPPAQPIQENFIIGIAAMWDKILALFLIPCVIFLMRRMASRESMRETADEKAGKAGKYDWAIIFSLIAAVLILINAYMIAVSGDVLKFTFVFQDTPYKFKFGSKDFIEPMAPYGYVWLTLGIGVLAAVIMLHVKSEYNLLWGGTIVALSGLSAIIGGGFIAGLILGVLGGLLSIIRERIEIFGMSKAEPLLYFLLAFIGNEADNAWGNVAFATPFVYEVILPLNLEMVRVSFLGGSYAYFIIRVIQAVIASLVAVPLINNLRAARFRLPKMVTKKPES